MVDVRRGDLVRLEYTGRLASNGNIFDTTSESVAKSAGIWEKSGIYGPKLAVFGQGTMMQGMEEAVALSAIGKDAEFIMPPSKAFGEKNADLMRMLPEKGFHKERIRPMPGMVVSLDGAMARVKSVNSGRVVVDMNHPLAGEKVVYIVRVHEVISDAKKKIEAILGSHGLAAKIAAKGKNYSVSFKKSDEKEKIESAKGIISVVVPGTEFSVS